MEESLEPSIWMLQWARIPPLHSSLEDKNKTPFQKKKPHQKKQTNKKTEDIVEAKILRPGHPPLWPTKSCFRLHAPQHPVLCLSVCASRESGHLFSQKQGSAIHIPLHLFKKFIIFKKLTFNTPSWCSVPAGAYEFTLFPTAGTSHSICGMLQNLSL